MAFRRGGSGRGGFRGGFRGGYRPSRQEPFELFPNITELGTAAEVRENISLAIWHSKFHKYWSSSPYHLDDENEAQGKTKSTDIERYSDRKAGKTRKKPLLSDYIRMEPDYLPAELAKGEKKVRRGTKRAKWNPDADMKKLDVFEKLEQKFQGEGENEDKEEEEEDDENVEEEEQEYSDDGDYNQNRDFDDDEDDFNMADDNDDEPMF